MSTGSIDRVQSDLNVIREALGLGPIWSMTDVRFGFALAGSSALFALFRWPGSPLAVPVPWAAAPVLVTLVVWLGYMAVKSRTLPRREESRRREYQLGIVMSLCGLIAYFGYGYWGKLIGLTQAQRGGVFLAFAGAATVILAIAQPAPRRYPRPYSITCGTPLLVLGLALPLTRPEYVASLIGSLVFLAVGASAFVMRHYVQAALAEEGARARN